MLRGSCSALKPAPKTALCTPPAPAADTASGPPAPLHALSITAAPLLRALGAALDNNSFLVNGGRLGFPCQARQGWPSGRVHGCEHG